MSLFATSHTRRESEKGSKAEQIIFLLMVENCVVNELFPFVGGWEVMKHSLFSSIGEWDRRLYVVCRYVSIGEKWQGFTLKNRQKKCHFGTFS